MQSLLLLSLRTTALYQMKLGEVVSTIPTIGFSELQQCRHVGIPPRIAHMHGRNIIFCLQQLIEFNVSAVLTLFMIDNLGQTLRLFHTNAPASRSGMLEVAVSVYWVRRKMVDFDLLCSNSQTRFDRCGGLKRTSKLRETKSTHNYCTIVIMVIIILTHVIGSIRHYFANTQFVWFFFDSNDRLVTGE
jgi:hypothetical protein